MSIKLVIIFIIFIFTSVTSIYSPLFNILNEHRLSNNNLNDRSLDILKILIEINSFLTKHSNVTLSGKEAEECIAHLYNLYNSSMNELAKCMSLSGKGLSDKGLEKECEQTANLTYILILFEMKEEYFSSFKEKEEVLFFMAQDTFYTGFCIPSQCKSWTKLFVSENNKLFNEYLKSKASPSVQSISLVDINQSKPSLGFILLTWTIAFLILLQIIGFFLSLIQTIHQSGDTTDTDNSIDSESTGEMAIFHRYTLPSPLKRNRKCKDVITSFSLRVNIINNLFLLFSKKSNYYNQCDIELLSFSQTILLLFLIFNQNMSITRQLPSRDFANESFYTSIFFFIVIISSYAIDCWVALEGMIMIYKLMFFLKKHVYNKDKFVSAKNFFCFYCKALSKIISGIFLFFVVHFYSNYFIGDLSFYEKNLFSYYMESTYNESLLDKTHLYLIPFYYYFNKEPYETITMQYVLIYINEFYVFTFFLIMVYFMLRFKSKLFDLFVLVIVCINVLLTYLTLDRSTIKLETIVSFQTIVESSYIRKYPHLLFNDYFIGVMGGMILFYFKDIISKKPMSINSITYLPFSYCFSINNYFYSITPFMKSLVMLLITLIGVLISMIYCIWACFDDKKLSMTITPLLRLVLVYDRIGFCIVFIILIVLAEMNMGKDGVFRHLINWKLFRVYARISFCFMCSFDVLIVGFYCLFNFQLKLSYENLWMVSIGLFLLCGVFTSVFTLALELPLRIIIRDIATKEESVIEPYLLPLEI